MINSEQSVKAQAVSAPTDNFVVGVDLGQTNLKGGVVRADGKLVHKRSAPSELHSRPAEIIDILDDFVLQLLQDARALSVPISGVGLSSTIDVDPQSGRVRSVSYPYLEHWLNFPIADHLQHTFKRDVVVENDGVAATWGEFRGGAGRGYHSILSVTLGTGIGGGAVLDGQRLPSSLGSGAYFGHMSIDINGPPCACGHRGCWELYASATALERRASQAAATVSTGTILPRNPTGKDIVNAAKTGDVFALQLLEETGHYLGFGLVNLLNLFNPQAVVIGGGLAQARDLLLSPAMKIVNNQRLPLRPSVDFTVAALGAFSGVVGAALLVSELSRQGP